MDFCLESELTRSYFSFEPYSLEVGLIRTKTAGANKSNYTASRGPGRAGPGRTFTPRAAAIHQPAAICHTHAHNLQTVTCFTTMLSAASFVIRGLAVPRPSVPPIRCFAKCKILLARP